jgi:alanine dehydrogenase
VHDVLHYAVGNIPGAVPHTSTYALTNATLRYVLALAAGVVPALQRSATLRRGVNVVNGQITHPAGPGAGSGPRPDRGRPRRDDARHRFII